MPNEAVKDSRVILNEQVENAMEVSSKGRKKQMNKELRKEEEALNLALRKALANAAGHDRNRP